MPHEYLDYPKDSVEGLLLSASLLTAYKEEEAAAQEKEAKKNPKLRQGTSRAKSITRQNPNRTKNMPQKRR